MPTDVSEDEIVLISPHKSLISKLFKDFLIWILLIFVIYALYDGISSVEIIDMNWVYAASGLILVRIVWLIINSLAKTSVSANFTTTGINYQNKRDRVYIDGTAITGLEVKESKIAGKVMSYAIQISYEDPESELLQKTINLEPFTSEIHEQKLMISKIVTYFDKFYHTKTKIW